MENKDCENCGITHSEPTAGASLYNPVAETKMLRRDLDVLLQLMKASPRKSRERSIAVTKLQESIMWLGMDLKEQGESNPYPHFYDPGSPVIDKTADNLRM